MTKSREPAIGTYGQEIDAATQTTLARAWFDPAVCSSVLVVSGCGRTRESRRARLDTVTYIIPIPRGGRTRGLSFETLTPRGITVRQSTVPYVGVISRARPPWNTGYGYRGGPILCVDNVDDPRSINVYNVPPSDAGVALGCNATGTDECPSRVYAGLAGVVQHCRSNHGLGNRWATRVLLSSRITEPLRARRSTHSDPWIVSVACEPYYENRTLYSMDQADTLRSSAIGPLTFGMGLPSRHWAWDDALYTAKWQEAVQGGLLAGRLGGC